MLREIGSAFVGENQNRGTEFPPFKPIENQAITNRQLTTLAKYAIFAETFSLYYFLSYIHGKFPAPQSIKK